MQINTSKTIDQLNFETFRGQLAPYQGFQLKDKSGTLFKLEFDEKRQKVLLVEIVIRYDHRPRELDTRYCITHIYQTLGTRLVVERAGKQVTLEKGISLTDTFVPKKKRRHSR